MQQDEDVTTIDETTAGEIHAGTDNTAATDAAPDTTATADPAQGSDLEAELAAARGEIETLRDQALRALADAENTRRRTQKELADTRAYAVSKFAESLLSVADNLGRALATAPDTLRGDAAFDAFVTGVEMTERELASALERHSVIRVGAPGDRFDPALHQAVAQIPSDEIASGAIAQVFQPGYVLSGRTLRAAMVAVSAGPGPAPGPKPVTGDGEAG
jgi:molecular chaperone GrpE